MDEGAAMQGFAFEYALEKEHVPIQRFFLRYDGRLPEVERFFERVLQLLEKNEYPSGQMELFAKLSIVALSIPELMYLMDVLEKYL